MAKTLSTQFKKGSFIDSVTKTVMTPNSVDFIKTSKGYAADFKGIVSTNHINTNIPSNQLVGNNCSIVANFKMKGGHTNYLFMSTRSLGSTYMALVCAAGLVKGYFANDSGGVDTKNLNGTIASGLDYQVIFTRENTNELKLYINNVLVASSSIGGQSPSSDTAVIGTIQNTLSNSFNGQIYCLDTYDHVLSEQERNTLYKEFLQSQITEKPIRGFELVKPTDLSYLKDTGLVAAYNMIPNGNTLVDISGNGNNGTIVGALRTKDGMMFNGVSDYADIADSTLTASTICARVKIKTSGVIQAIITTGNSSPLLAISSSNTLYGHASRYRRGVLSGVNYLNNWINIVSVFTGSEVYQYVNGVEVSYSSDGAVGDAGSFIGKRTIGDFFNGEIQDIRIYNYAFTPEQAKAYHNSWIKPVTLEDWSGSAVGDII